MTASQPPVGYIKIGHGKVDRTVECGAGTQVDVAADGRVLGIETIGHSDFHRGAFAALRSLRVAQDGGRPMADTRRPDPACDYVLREVQAERVRAHAKHGDTSMESLPVDDLTRLTVLMEEVGEVACEFNEARHYGFLDTPSLRAELIQVAAMATAWADALTHASANGDHGHA